jgi:hypothetical protein
VRELALAIVLSAISWAANAETVHVGDALVEFDPARFAVRARGDGGVTIACVAATGCGRRGDRNPTIHVSSAPAVADQPACWPGDMRVGQRERRESVTVGVLSFEVMSADSGCRALSPGFLGACTKIGSNAFRMTTGGFGCSNAPIFPRSMLLELIRGVRPAP